MNNAMICLPFAGALKYEGDEKKNMANNNENRIGAVRKIGIFPHF